LTSAYRLRFSVHTRAQRVRSAPVQSNHLRQGFNGGDGNDTLDFSGFEISAGVTVDLANGSVMIDGSDNIVSSVETVIGTSAGDSITGSSGADVLNGGEGNDALNGGAGNDIMDGGNGNDVFIFAAARSGASPTAVRSNRPASPRARPAIVRIERMVLCLAWSEREIKRYRVSNEPNRPRAIKQ
jgi:RTX calcium-binding nonapeptide repeat (4 copies)